MSDPKRDSKQAEQPEQPTKSRRRVKKAKAHGGHHGGAWKVAYADFVTAMMALFLVLWLVSQADTKLKEAIASYFRSPGVFDHISGGVLSGAKKVSSDPSAATSKDDEQALFSVAQTLQKKFATRPEFSKVKDQVKVDVTEEGLRIQIIDKADKVSFSSGSAELNPEASQILTEIANGICGLPNKINIGGHTDSYVFPSTKGYTNWELSADRANAARRVLQSVCVKPEQIRRIVGFADTEPMVPNDLFAPANRRISITVLRQPVDNKNAENKDAKEEKSVIESDEKKLKEARRETSSETPKSAAKPKSVEESEENADADTAEESAETKTAKAKLKNEGAVSVGEPDVVPNKPQVKEAKKAEH